MDHSSLTPEEKQTEALLKAVQPAPVSPHLVEQMASRLESEASSEAFERALLQVRPAEPGGHLWEAIEAAMEPPVAEDKILQPRLWSQMAPALKAAAVIAIGLVLTTLFWNPPADPGSRGLTGPGPAGSGPVTIESTGRVAPVSHRIGELSEKGIIMRGDKFYRSVEREMIELHHLRIDGDPVEVERPRRERLLIPMEVY